MSPLRKTTSDLPHDLALAASLRPERADQMRRRLVSAVRSFFDCAAAIYLGFAAAPGEVVSTSVTAASSDEGGTFGHLEGVRLPLERDVVRYPLDRGSDAFHASGALLGFRHSVTAVVFDGASAVGSVSALFARARPHPGLVAALNESLPEVRHLVLRAAELDEQALGADKHAVAIAEGDGRLAAISETAETWLDDRRRARLEARLQTALAAGGPMELVLDGALVACEPEARGGRYIVTMRAAPRPRLPRDHVLTQRQRRICTLIAGGTSHGEVARALGVSDKTIARHVHDAYAALGVSSVDGLRAVLGGSEAATFGKGRGAAGAPFDATSRA